MRVGRARRPGGRPAIRRFSNQICAVLLTAFLGQTADVAQAQLSKAPSIDPGQSVVSFAVSDVDGNESDDLVLGVQNALVVALGNGEGTFTLAEPIDFTGVPKLLEVADLNADGNQDVAAVDGDERVFRVLFGDGEGDFEPEKDLRTKRNPTGLDSGLFDSDRRPDLALSATNKGRVTLFRSEGPGLFNATTLKSGKFPEDIEAADFNGDEDEDLGVATAKGIVTRYGRGSGEFGRRKVTEMTGSDQLSSADLNADDALDLAVAKGFDGTSVMLATKPGPFGAATTNGWVGEARDVALHDVDGDGKVDQVVGVGGFPGFGSQLSYLPGEGGRSFGEPVGYELDGDADRVAIGDFDGELGADVAVLSSGHPSTFRQVEIFLGE